MAGKKSKLDATVERVAQMLEAHVDTLTADAASAMRNDILDLGFKSASRALRRQIAPRAKRGKASKSRQTSDLRLLSRAAAARP